MTGPTFDLLLDVGAAWFVIILAAQVLGWLAPKIGQPAVVGEMAAGVILGPSLLGWVWPAAGEHLFTAEVKEVLFVIAMVGLSLYMFVVGVEHEHEPESRKEATFPIAVALAGIIIPLMVGAGAAAIIAGEYKPDDVGFWVFILFVGGSLTVTAFPMLARILQQQRMMHTRFGGVATRAAAIDDALAWCLLAVLSGIATKGSASGVIETVLPAIAFALVCYWALPLIFRKVMERAVADNEISDGLFGALLLTVLGAGWFTDYIGIYSVFGGFVVGMTLPSVPGFADLLKDRLLQTVRCLMLPVFFAYSGLNTDLTTLSGSVLLVLALMLVVAFGSKTIASMGVARAYGWSWGQSTALSALMNARGLMILIFINIGLSLGVIEQRLFSVLVVVAVLTTAMAMPIYRRYYTPEREEAERVAATRTRVAAPPGSPPIAPADHTGGDRPESPHTDTAATNLPSAHR
ncbi:cation:proton antiporter [Gordonia pseudamarae]|jgi:Kef-type K+ transport system membrane component KefB|uniref:Cation:proton antiporter n=1 Tax=Gordonia pseudamarae TaxID=2831662 RepID=A0ABX6IET5_9ACTN|nr:MULTISPECIES: cation:proton antiporter [Gordonia]MBD0023618.1 cation:proton antiporter [Gordonia sp. (in: high G+C Gram-positive bacteria)]QHN25435.1 cation:proton antiporter [Gordonia pseudamarae]QHN34367.1 cation:proton antiporter [Gordonia pseudamarae]